MAKKSLLANKKWLVFPASLVIVVSLIIFLFSIWRLLFTQPSQPVFVKVKVSQGLWWANTQSPGVWILRGLKVGEKEVNLLGRSQAEIVKVSYYTSVSSSFRYESEYNVYVILKINVDRDANGRMLFKRAAVSVGSPIEAEFPSGSLSGNIIEISDSDNFGEYVTKNIILTKRSAFPWEYESVLIGEKQTDGNDTVFEVVGKKALDTNTIGVDPYGNYQFNDKRKYLQVFAKVRVKKDGDLFLFGEEQVLRVGYPLIVSTDGYFFDNFVVERIY